MPTIRDVAREAGVSIATVSYVLNNSKAVSDETRQRVLEAAQRLGYRPSSLARGLQARQAYILGYSWRPMPSGELNVILDLFLETMAQVAARHGYHILAYPTFTLQQEVNLYRELVETQRVDGFILSNTTLNDPRIRFLLDVNFPFAAFGRSNPDWDFPWVDVDGTAGMHELVRHLVGLGHTRIACLAWPEDSLTGGYRLAGYYAGMEEAGLTVDPVWVPRMPMDYQEAYRAAQSLLALPPSQRPTAFMAMTDVMALGVMNAALDAGLVVGRDVAVAGYDDIPTARYVRPPLTSLRQPIPEVGEQAVSMLLSLVDGEDPPQRHVLLDPELIIRASTTGTSR